MVPLSAATKKALSGVHRRDRQVLTRYDRRTWGSYTAAGLRTRIKRLRLKPFGVNPFSLTLMATKGRTPSGTLSAS